MNTATAPSADMDCADAFEATATDPTTDCNDANEHSYPGAFELCDGEDNDCEGDVDEGYDEGYDQPYAEERYEDSDAFVRSTNGYVGDAEALLRRIIEVIATAPTMPLSSSPRIDRDEIIELLEECLHRLPEEMRHARWMIKERQEFVAKTRREADELLEAARVQAERMVQRTEVVRAAEAKARQVLESANADTKRMKNEMEDYLDQRLASFEIFKSKPMPSWGSDLSGIDFDRLQLDTQTLESDLAQNRADYIASLSDCASLLFAPCDPGSASLDALTPQLSAGQSSLPADWETRIAERADIRALQAAQAATKEDVTLALKRRVPDPIVSVGFTRDRFVISGNNPRVLQMGVTIPIATSDRGQYDAARATAEGRELQESASAITIRAKAEAQALSDRQAQLGATVDLLRTGALARADTILQSTSAAVTQGGVSDEMLTAAVEYLGIKEVWDGDNKIPATACSRDELMPKFLPATITSPGEKRDAKPGATVAIVATVVFFGLFRFSAFEKSLPPQAAPTTARQDKARAPKRRS